MRPADDSSATATGQVTPPTYDPPPPLNNTAPPTLTRPPPPPTYILPPLSAPSACDSFSHHFHFCLFLFLFFFLFSQRLYIVRFYESVVSPTRPEEKKKKKTLSLTQGRIKELNRPHMGPPGRSLPMQNRPKQN